MCGIAAGFRAGGGHGPLAPALEAMRHRGPDGVGDWTSGCGRAVLGHARLAVVDPAGGRQPLISEDGRIALAMNGEVYGDAELRRELEGRGHRFRSRSDSEVALHLYEERGLPFLAGLRGEFALVLWDGRSGTLLAARDRFGTRPLVWARHAGGVLVASQAKALFALGHPRAWDEEAFLSAAAMQYPPPDRTLFAGIRPVPPGCALVVDREGVRLRRWWVQDEPAPEPAAPADPASLREVLEEAVRVRLRGDVPVCFHLSGGLDSTAVAALAAPHTELRCFTVGFDREGWDELPLARRTAARLGARLHEVPLTPRDLVGHLGPAVRATEGLAVNGHLPAKFLLSRAIRDAGYKVALTGEGADEVLGGYPHFRLDQDPGAAASLYAQNRASAGIMVTRSAGLDTSALREALGFVPAFLQAKAALGLRLNRLLRPELRARSAEAWTRLAEGLDLAEFRGRHPVRQSMLLWNRMALAGYLLSTLGDGAELAHSVEGRLPFLDARLFEHLRAVPVEDLIRDGVEKHLLREALRPEVGEEQYSRRKHPFMAPPLAGSPELQQVLREARLPYLDAAEVAAVLDSLPHLPPEERAEWDPALVWAACAVHLDEGLLR